MYVCEIPGVLFKRKSGGRALYFGLWTLCSKKDLTTRWSKWDGYIEAKGKKNRRSQGLHRTVSACLEPLVTWLLTRGEGKDLGKCLRASISHQWPDPDPSLGIPPPAPRGHTLLPLDSLEVRGWAWVTVPVTRADHRPQSCQWHCTGRWQTGQHSPRRSESAWSGGFWLHEEKEWKMLKVELCHSRVSFGIYPQFRAFPFCFPLKKIMPLLPGAFKISLRL